MKMILNRYESIYIQVVNFNKSLFTFSSNTTEHHMKEVCNQFGVRGRINQVTTWAIPICIGRNKVSEFYFLLERIKQTRMK